MAMFAVSIPVTLITGFLGSGKTTLINKLISGLPEQRFAVVENEFGETGVDAEFLSESGAEKIIQLANGCLCCTVRGDLAQSLYDIKKYANEASVSLDRVLIETTGIADPGPILQTFLAETELLNHFHIDGVVALVDGLHGAGTLEVKEFSAQLAYADRVLVTKLDGLDSSRLEALMADISRISPLSDKYCANVFESDVQQIAAFIFDSLAYKLDYVDRAGLERKINSSRKAMEHGHTQGVTTFSYQSERKFDLGRLNAFLDRSVNRYGNDLWRCKGVINAIGISRKLVLQGVQTLIQLNGGSVWRPYENKKSTLVFIGRNLDVVALSRDLDGCVEP